MYTVNFYHNSQLINSFTFGTEQKAEQCLISHADYRGLNVREDLYYASSDGIKPETEIEIVYSEN